MSGCPLAVALVVVVSAVADNAQQPPPAQPGTRSQTPRIVPPAQYSPLAAQGGYGQSRRSPFEAIVNALNPQHANYGRIWEEWRRVWLENAGTNRYFWYSFSVTAALLVSWFVLAWMYNDRIRERLWLAEHAADALRYAEYCKRRGREAIDRHNAHVEKCNRVIEAGESGMVTPETANLEDYRRELTRLAAENDTKEVRLKRLQEELDQKNADYAAISKRIEQAEQRVNARAKGGLQNEGSAQLAERINRLESENRTLNDELRRLRQVQRQAKSAEAS